MNRDNGGDTDKITRDYFDSLLVEMRHIDAVEPSTKLELYGESFNTPVMMAALSHLNTVHPEGMVEAARGMVAAGGVMWAGMGDEAELEAINATGARTIKIIKPYLNNRDILQKIEHAEKCGCIGVGIDIDHQFGSKNCRGSVLNLPVKPKTLKEIESFVKSTKLPFIIKGVLSTVDAQKCLDAGVRGIVVSHHHGMVDYAVPPLQILPAIGAVINRHIPIFVDCCISRGMDVFKALAWGATAVSVGRSLMEALRTSGWHGVCTFIAEMTNELNWAMAVTGSPDITHIDPQVIVKK
ncbi:MAG: alpha-hydroxy-acid oxidizing protein [Spirochaetaceae bacterium]|jgi:isopentenyl diphosphate isomerase/L-lactate dehydrogenase-like FMN-dependent dehydrogenase|nr:alpha-hydroxy-acid oxidizing protein [Spirochaetaceae bacterium]